MTNILDFLKNGYLTLKRRKDLLSVSLINSILIVSMNYCMQKVLPFVSSLPSVFGYVYTLLLLILLGISYIISLFFVGVMIHISNKKASLSKSFEFVEKRFGALVLGNLLYLLFFVVGLLAYTILEPLEFFIFLIIETFFVTKIIFFPYAILIENKKASESFKRSYEITENHWWDTFALILIFMAVPFLITSVYTYFSGFYFLNEIYFILLFFVNLFLIPWEAASFVYAYISFRDLKKF
jgi:hypothetical protein